MSRIDILRIAYEIALRWMPQHLTGAGNGLVVSGNKPLPE